MYTPVAPQDMPGGPLQPVNDHRQKSDLVNFTPDDAEVKSERQEAPPQQQFLNHLASLTYPQPYLENLPPTMLVNFRQPLVWSLQQQATLPSTSVVSPFQPSLIDQLRQPQIPGFLGYPTSDLNLPNPAGRPTVLSLNNSFQGVWTSAVPARNLYLQPPGSVPLVLQNPPLGNPQPSFERETSTAVGPSKVKPPEDEEESQDGSSGSSSSRTGDEPLQGNRVRSTLQMTSFLSRQIRQFNFFSSKKTREERLLLRSDWERAWKDFNKKFHTNVTMTAYRRKISHLRRMANKNKGSLGARKRTSSSADGSKTKRSKNSESEDDDEDPSNTDD